MQFLRREVGARVVAAPADSLAGGQELVAGALGEAVRAHRLERVVRPAQLATRVETPAHPPEPLAVAQPGAGQVRRHARPFEIRDRPTVELLGQLVAGDERERT